MADSNNCSQSIYPRDLKVAVENFSGWLCQQVSVIKKDMDRLDSSGKIMVVLLGHSMGGIVCKSMSIFTTDSIDLYSLCM